MLLIYTILVIHYFVEESQNDNDFYLFVLLFMHLADFFYSKPHTSKLYILLVLAFPENRTHDLCVAIKMLN